MHAKQKFHLFGGTNDGGGYYARFEPETKGLVKNRMTVDEYLAHEPEEEKPYSKQILGILDSEAEVWSRVWWQLLEAEFLGWYIWLKDNLAMVREWVKVIQDEIIIKTC